MTYFLKIFGCQMNYSDAERISTILTKYKMKPAASTHEADLVVFVTCGVRQSAEDRVYGQIHNIRKKYPRKKIVLTGCLAHRKDVQGRLEGKVDLFCEIKNFESLALRNLKKSDFEDCPELSSGQEKVGLWKKKKSSFDLKNNYLKTIPRHANTYTAYIPVMTGCNNFCSYCVVPYARGREYSRPVDDILKEIKDLVKKGCKEIILLGQNVNSYNSKFRVSNFESNSNSRIFNSKLNHSKLFQNSKFKIQNSSEIKFASLLKIIDAIPGRFWLTFLTSHPKDMSDELIEMIAQSKKICEYVSLPAQSGDNEILRKMNRKYTIAHYKNLIKKIKLSFEELRTNSEQGKSLALKKIPPAISTDIIVGFPGESRKQFENTAKLFREIKFDMAYINQYSPRPETAAWKFRDNVSKKEKVRRERFLTEILKHTALENNKKYIGKIVEVLVDKKLSFEESRISEKVERKGLFSEPRKYLAHTRTQKKVIFYSNKKIPVGSFAKVKITKAKAFGLEGVIK